MCFFYFVDVECGDNKENGSKECSYVINAGSQGEENNTTLKDDLSLPKADIVDFTVIYNKNKFDVKFPLDDTVGQLKKHLQDIIGERSTRKTIYPIAIISDISVIGYKNVDLWP